MTGEPTPPDADASGDAAGTGAPHPTVDLLTDKRAIIISQRPVVGLSSWLADVLTRTPEAGVVLTIVTPKVTRLTLPVRMLASDGFLQWVVRTDEGDFYDGLLGNRLTFDGADFAGSDDRAGQFDELPEPEAWQVIVSLTVEHRATIHAQLGGAVEVLSRELTGTRPAGWGAHEPVSEPWDRARLTTLARRRMPRDTRLVAVGAGGSTLIATLRPSRTERGVEESVLCLINAGPLTRPIEDVSQAVRAALRDVAAGETVGFAVAHLRPGRADLTEPAHARAQPVPLAILVGPRAVKAIGRQRFFSPSLPVPTEVGRPRVPGLLFELGKGDVPPWHQLTDLVTQLGADRLRAAAPGLADLSDLDGFPPAGGGSVGK